MIRLDLNIPETLTDLLNSLSLKTFMTQHQPLAESFERLGLSLIHI